MKNVLHITNSSVKSNFLLSIARFYNSDKYQFFIGSFSSRGELQNELDKMNVKTFNFEIKDERLAFLSFFSFYKYIKKNKIDIIHVHTFWVSLYFGFIGKIMKTKVVMTRHHADLHIRDKKHIHTKLDSLTARFIVNKVVAVSNFTKKIMVEKEKVPSNKISVVYNGLENLSSSNLNKVKFKETYSIPESDKILLCISRLHPEKDIETIISAIAKTKNTHLLVAGNGLNTEYHLKLITLSKKLDVFSRIHFLGFRNDIKDLLAISDVLTHSSLCESFGFVVAEAMQQKTPIIATRIPALLEVATDEVAFFYTPKNVLELTELINNVLFFSPKNELELRIKKGERRYKELFTFEKMMFNYENIYEQL